MEDTLFDRILKSIGDNGKFQKRFNFFFNFLFVICCSMAYNNLTIIMTVPNHWCHIPGRENTSFSLLEWRNMHLPEVLDTKGRISLSNCKMYNMSNLQHGNQLIDLDVTTCQHGYDFDKTWYSSTVATEQSWVCDKQLYNSNVLAGSRLGLVVGTFILGQFGDYIGRRPTFLLAVILCLVAKAVSLFTSGFYYVFLISNALAHFPALSAMQCTLVIGTETTNAAERARMVQVQNLSWCIGMIVMPLLFWVIPGWILSYIATTAPLIIFVFIYGWTIESPRWLASRGNIQRALKELKKISEINGTTLEPDLVAQLQYQAEEPEKSYGVLSTMSSWRLSKNTIILNVVMTVPQLCMFIIALESTNLEGNPYLNFVWQGAAEAPAYIIGKILCDKIGRRYSASLTSFFTAAMFIGVTFLIKCGTMAMATNSLVMLGKFFLTISFYAVLLQMMEIYPTCIRQSGISLGYALSGGFSVVCPYIVFLGATVDARYPYLIMGVMSMLCALLQFFLPETLHVKLPETLREAKEFGHEQSFFHVPGKPKDVIDPEEMQFVDSKMLNKVNK